MEHPNEAQRIAQQKFLGNLEQPDKDFHARMFRIGNATYHYYGQNEPSEQDYLSWLEGLQEPMKSGMSKKGYEACRNMLSLKRHSLELRDLGLDAFMKKNLSTDDYKWWGSQKTL